MPDTCHMEQGAEYNGEDVIEWGTDNLKVDMYNNMATLCNTSNATGIDRSTSLSTRAGLLLSECLQWTAGVLAFAHLPHELMQATSTLVVLRGSV